MRKEVISEVLLRTLEGRPQPPRDWCPFPPTCLFLSPWGPAWLAALGRGVGVEPRGEAVVAPRAACSLWVRR